MPEPFARPRAFWRHLVDALRVTTCRHPTHRRIAFNAHRLGHSEQHNAPRLAMSRGALCWCCVRPSGPNYQALPDSFSRSAASCSSLASEPPDDAGALLDEALRLSDDADE